jgi:hypothetical protein
VGDTQLGAPTNLSYAQIQQLWIANGGPAGWAPLMAGIAIAESGGNAGILNNTPSTGDYSVGLWQINYFGNLMTGRTAQYGSPASLANDPNGQAKAAIELFGGGAGIGNWKGDATYNAWVAAGRPQQPSSAVVQSWLGGQGSGDGGGPVTAQDTPTASGTAGTCGANGGGLDIFGAHIGDACQLKALAGGLLVGLGGGIMLVGATLIAAYGLSHTGVGQAVAGVAKTTGASKVAGGVRKAATPAGRAARRQEGNDRHSEREAATQEPYAVRQERYRSEGFAPRVVEGSKSGTPGQARARRAA